MGPECHLVAADADGLPGDAPGRLGGEEGDEGRAVLGVPKPSPLRRKSGSGSPFLMASMYGAKAGMVSVIAVAATGTIALTVMPARPSSMDQVRAKAAMPALAAA